MSSRELTADDIVFNYHRYLGLGDFSEAGPSPKLGSLVALPFESITVTDNWTVVMKLKEPRLFALDFILDQYSTWDEPPRGNQETRRRQGLEEPGRHWTLYAD